MLVENETTCISNSKEISNLFNHYFTNIGMASFPNNVNSCEFCNGFFCSKEIQSENSFFFEIITGLEVLQTINNLNNSTTVGTDGISSKLVNKTSLYLVDILAHIFNKSVYSGG